MRNSSRPLRDNNRAKDKPVKVANPVSRLESLKAFIREGEDAEVVAKVVNRWLDELETDILKALAEGNTELSENLTVLYRTGLRLSKFVNDAVDTKKLKEQAYERVIKDYKESV